MTSPRVGSLTSPLPPSPPKKQCMIMHTENIKSLFKRITVTKKSAWRIPFHTTKSSWKNLHKVHYIQVSAQGVLPWNYHSRASLCYHRLPACLFGSLLLWWEPVTAKVSAPHLESDFCSWCTRLLTFFSTDWNNSLSAGSGAKKSVAAFLFVSTHCTVTWRRHRPIWRAVTSHPRTHRYIRTVYDHCKFTCQF